MDKKRSNGNTLDNYPENLEWMSHHDNIKHASKTGLIDHKKMGKVVSKKVNKYSINGTFICSYPSVTIATESLDRITLVKCAVIGRIILHLVDSNGNMPILIMIVNIYLF